MKSYMTDSADLFSHVARLGVDHLSAALSGVRQGRRLPWLTGHDQASLAEEVLAGELRGGGRGTERRRVRRARAAGPEGAGSPDPGAGPETRPGHWRHAAPIRQLHLPDQLPHR